MLQYRRSCNYPYSWPLMQLQEIGEGWEEEITEATPQTPNPDHAKLFPPLVTACLNTTSHLSLPSTSFATLAL